MSETDDACIAFRGLLNTAEEYVHISLLCCLISLYLNLNGIGHTGTEIKMTVNYSSDWPIGFSSYVIYQSHVNIRLEWLY